MKIDTLSLFEEKEVESLLSDLQSLIEQTKTSVAHAVNSALVIMYWNIGKSLRNKTVHSKNSVYNILFH